MYLNIASFEPAIGDFSSDALFSKQSGRGLRLRNPDYSGKWNWGAFFFGWLWMVNHGKVRVGLGVLLLDFVPIVGLLARIYCGISGNDIAYDGRRFASVGQFVAVQNVWRNWAFAMMLFVFAIAAFPLTNDGLRAANSAYAAAQTQHGNELRTIAANRARDERQRVAVEPQRVAVERAETKASAQRKAAATQTAAARRKQRALLGAALEAHPCESGLNLVYAATTATFDQGKYEASVSALRFAGKCGERSVALRTRALALAQKAIAEHHRKLGDWRKDINESFVLSSRCAAAGLDSDGRDGDDCRRMAERAVQISSALQVDD